MPGSAAAACARSAATTSAGAPPRSINSAISRASAPGSVLAKESTYRNDPPVPSARYPITSNDRSRPGRAANSLNRRNRSRDHRAPIRSTIPDHPRPSRLAASATTAIDRTWSR